MGELAEEWVVRWTFSWLVLLLVLSSGFWRVLWLWFLFVSFLVGIMCLMYSGRFVVERGVLFGVFGRLLFGYLVYTWDFFVMSNCNIRI